jgi:urease accessory protein
MNDLARIRLMQLVSPALPIGAFAYSRGLESAVELGIVRDRETAQRWLADVLEHQIARLDAPVLVRLLLHEGAELERWREFYCVTRETSEAVLESEQLGASLARLAVDLKLVLSSAFPARPSYLASFAVLAKTFELSRTDAVLGLLYAWLENSVTAAVKLVPLGQTDGQRILFALSAKLPELCSAACAQEDEDVGAILPALALAGALHETQHTRLFRS